MTEPPRSLPPPRAPRPPRLYAHRGAPAELPENTLPSFERALDLGADALETDAHLTRDGHVVLSHDPTGMRMCGVPARIADATLAEVQTWDAGYGFTDSGGARVHAGKGFRFPTLEEVLRALPLARFNVDAKSTHPQMVPRLLEVLKRENAEERTLVASFDVRTLRQVRRLGYPGKTGLAQAEVWRLVALPLALHGFVPLRGAAAQLPYRIYGIDLGTRAVVAKCHALGLEVHYWTVNDGALAERLLGAGADAIMTDDPRSLAPVLERWRRGHPTHHVG